MSIAYITTIERRVAGLLSAGHSPVFKAVARNQNGTDEPVFIKFIDDVGLFNEIFASELGNILRLPTVNSYLCACPSYLLKGEELPFSIPRNEFKLVVASVDANKIRFLGGNGALERLENDLLSWPDLPVAAAFDELIMNDDRNYQNILKISENRFSLIDHEQAFGRIESINKLEKIFLRSSQGNFLASLIFKSGYDLPKRKIYNVVNELSEKVQSITGIVNSDLIYLEKNKLEDGYTSSLIRSIKLRAQNLQELIHQHQLSSERLFALSSN